MNPNTPLKTLLDLAKDPDKRVRAVCPQTPAEELVRLSLGEDATARMYLSDNPALPASVQATVSSDAVVSAGSSGLSARLQ